jgi:hypothetical protein
MTIYVPGKVTLAKEFTVQDYMWNFPQQYGLWSPAEITTALWLDAADASTVITESGAVSQWNDKSGNNRNATQSAPASRPLVVSSGQNSRNIFRFDGSDDWLNAAYAMPIHNIGVFAVWQANIFPQGLTFMRPTSDGRFYFGSINNTKGAATLALTANENWRIQYLSGSSTQMFLSVNGGVVSTASDTNTATTASVLIGGGTTTSGGTTPTDYFDIDIGELVMVPGTPSDTNRQKIEGYLAHKWGLTANLPSDHPYKLVGPTP